MVKINHKKVPAMLVERFISGDFEAFHEIYEQTKDFVFNVVYRILQNHEDTQDVSHDIYIKIYEKRKTYLADSEFNTWLYRVAINMAIKHSNRKKWFYLNIPFFSDIFHQMGEENSIEIDEQEAIQSTLDKISPLYKACLVLKDVQGFTYEEIAATLQISIGTVRSRISRGREKLLNLYKECEVYAK